jgi:hypothetical protein
MVDEAERERIRRLSHEELAEELGQEAEKGDLNDPASELYTVLLEEFDRRLASREIEEPDVPEDFIPRMLDRLRRLPPPDFTGGQPDTTIRDHNHEGRNQDDTERERGGQ